MKIVVLAGGLSPERDVSLSTGTLVTNALRRCGHQAIPVDLFFGMPELPDPIEKAFDVDGFVTPLDVPQIAPDLKRVRAQRESGFSDLIGNGVLELCRAADITFLALHGGDGENGKLQAFFDLCGVRYTGATSFGCALAMNKAVAKSLFRGAGVPTADWLLLTEEQTLHPDLFPLPCVVKPNNGGSSIGVAIVREDDDTEVPLLRALHSGFSYENELLVERYIEGTELSVGVLGNPNDSHDNVTALPPIEIVPKTGFYDYANKYQKGWTNEYVPARIDPASTQLLQEYAVAAYRALGLSVYSRVDFLLTADKKPYCLEVNTLPGMTPNSLLPQEAAATGLDYAALCNRIVLLSLQKYRAL